MAGKTLLVTGATSGIGLEAAVALARSGVRVVMVGRNALKTAEKVEEVRRRSGATAVESLLCDFSSQRQVRQLAERFQAGHDRLDVLVNNAGAVFAKRTLTEDGIEATFAVNHLGPFLLTNLLLACLAKGTPARVVNVASGAHYGGTMDLDDLGFERGYRIIRAYARSKLANVLFTRELAKRLDGSGITVNCLHPGRVATNIWNGAPAWIRPVFSLVKNAVMISPAAGAETIVYLASSPDVEGKTGLYLEKNHPKPPSHLAQDDALARRLWDESARLVRLSG